MKKEIIKTTRAPAAIGTYSQAVKAGNTVYLSGQIPLDPASGEMVAGEIRVQIARVFDNLAAVAKAAGGSLQDVVKLNVFLTDLKNFPQVNEIMAQYFQEPYPARAAVGVAALPRGAQVEMDAVMVMSVPAKTQRKGAKAQRKALRVKTKFRVSLASLRQKLI
jgi:reactive intermediate/imine deaminase